ncbi:MAG: alpha-mannosidase [Clostridiales bacterium]|jgi:alpha-mannosidase|nr:alpha-mannosidase [Clostridiales bacterium]
MNLQARIEALAKVPAGRDGERVLMELRYAREVARVAANRSASGPGAAAVGSASGSGAATVGSAGAPGAVPAAGPAAVSSAVGEWEGVLLSATEILETGAADEGVISRAVAEAAESALLPMRDVAKRYTVLCAGHAHIDMNWMWRYDETVSITLDTFRTVLGLMREYPEFRFSQSQASVYEIVERFDPEMLEEIRRRVAEGRWEVSASTWVEADRNMPSGESVARHLLYTRRYLSRLLGVPAGDLTLDYEPDTFGHAALTPELLLQGGVRYYYHCRGDEGEALYRWRAPSGAEILCYREPYWYLGPITADFALGAPAFCERYGVDTHLRVFGVGDHGGGPTRRDIERLLDMASWPVFPQMRFGTYKEFYAAMERAARPLPVVAGELNPVFTGCYTSQARVTQGNRYAEAKLDEGERFAARAALTTTGAANLSTGAAAAAPAAATERAAYQYPNEQFEQAWRHVMFNQFHDILPGSGVIDTREYAMGLYTQAYAAADTQKAKALRALAALADTSVWAQAQSPQDRSSQPDSSTSEGGGVGFGLGYGMSGMAPFDAGAHSGAGSGAQGRGRPFRLAQTERGRGLTRVFHVFNPSATPREEVVELTMFDWPGELRRLKLLGANGAALRFQLVDTTPKNYWQHEYVRILVMVALPAGGETVCVCTQDDEVELLPRFPMDPRVERPHEYILENEYLRAEFCPDSGALLSLVDKETGAELIAGSAATFRIIDEQPATGTAGTAWTVGRCRAVTDLSADVTMRRALTGELVNAISITAHGRASKVSYTVSLASGARMLDFDCEVDWREVGEPGARTPQLNFSLPVARLEGDGFIQDIPGGLLERPPAAIDMPCQSFSAARYAPGKALMLVSDSKYGFRCEESERYGYVNMNLDCLRSSTDPDPYPEFGTHRFRIGVGISESRGAALLESAYTFCHPALTISAPPHRGPRPPETAGIAVTGAFLQAAKLAEDCEKAPQAASARDQAPQAASAREKAPQSERPRDLVLRLIRPEPNDGEAEVTLWDGAKILSAVVADTHESPLPGAPAPLVRGGSLTCPIRAHGTLTLRVTLRCNAMW